MDGTDPRMFATTRWSLVLSAANPETVQVTSNPALAELCRIYWRPVFHFVCRRGYLPQEAQDLTQDFFLMILESDWLKHADQTRGRFRSFLLKSVQNFLGHAAEKRNAVKRGGRLDFVSWEDWMREAQSREFADGSSLPAEEVFDQRWAATVVEQALGRLRDECERAGRRRLFESLSGHLAAERGEVSYTGLAGSLGIAEAAVKKQLHNLRQRYRSLLREEVAGTVQNEADVDDEIRHLCAVLARA